MWAPRALRILRVVSAFLIQQHGVKKLFGVLTPLPTPRTEELSRPEVARDSYQMMTLIDECQQAGVRLRSLYEEWERTSAEAAYA